MPERRKDLSVIIVSYNVCDFLAACLKSIFHVEHRCSFEVWVVENGSHDGSLDMVKQDFPQVNLIESGQNLGFAAANNLAIMRCTGRYFLLLNPDTLVMKNALDSLVDFLDTHQNVGGAGSRLLNPDLSLQPSAFPFTTLGREFWRLFYLDAIYPYALYRQQDWSTYEPRRVDVLQGTSLALRRSALEDIGLLDVSFFMYSEEVDLCYRLHIGGWQLFWVPASKIVHYGGQSTRQTAGEMFLQLYRAKIFYFRKHHGMFSAEVYKVILSLAALVRLIAYAFFRFVGSEHRAQQEKLAGFYRNLIRNLSEY